MLAAALGLAVALVVAAALLRAGPPTGPARAARLLVRRSGVMAWGYGPAALAVLALALLGHGGQGMLVALVGMLALAVGLSAAFLARLRRSEG